MPETAPEAAAVDPVRQAEEFLQVQRTSDHLGNRQETLLNGQSIRRTVERGGGILVTGGDGSVSGEYVTADVPQPYRVSGELMITAAENGMTFVVLSALQCVEHDEREAEVARRRAQVLASCEGEMVQ